MPMVAAVSTLTTVVAAVEVIEGSKTAVELVGAVVTTMVALMITAVSAMMLEVAQAEAAAGMTDSEATTVLMSGAVAGATVVRGPPGMELLIIKQKVHQYCQWETRQAMQSRWQVGSN